MIDLDAVYGKFLKWTKRYGHWHCELDDHGFISVKKTRDRKQWIVTICHGGQVNSKICANIGCAWAITKNILLSEPSLRVYT